MHTELSVKRANFVFFGGSTGIGHTAALELGRSGAPIVIVGRSREAGEAAVAAVKAAGARRPFFYPATCPRPPGRRR
jgi:NAD(P)-dependent dehydrogenase (short-subunit alcohol dehydrogenase family)